MADSKGLPLQGMWTLVRTESGNVRIRIFEAGEGPTLVLLPGQGSGPRGIEPLAVRLKSAGFRIVLPEPRGYGESVGPSENVGLTDLASDVIQAIEAITNQPVVIVGHAFGNRVGRMVASMRPDLVRGTVLLAAGGKFAPKEGAVAQMRKWQDMTLTADQRFAAAKRSLLGSQSTVTLDALIRDAKSEDALIIQRQATDPRNSSLESWWPGGTARMLVIQGLDDVIAPPENGRSLKAEYPDRVTLIELPGVGHSVWREAPDAVVREISSFVRNLK